MLRPGHTRIGRHPLLKGLKVRVMVRTKVRGPAQLSGSPYKTRCVWACYSEGMRASGVAL